VKIQKFGVFHDRIQIKSNQYIYFLNISIQDSHDQSRVLVVRAPRLSCADDLRMVHRWVGGCKDGQPDMGWADPVF
jgi:hypothetical protein